MPILHVTLISGRTAEQIEEFAAAVTHATSATLHTPPETVRIVINSVAPEHYYIAGKRKGSPTSSPDGEGE
ncbi:tautomerase family protein (plasmid) [Mycolicibacterium psychrotolerans]|uniref:tautomerase family protein n=1 Tax=Mycolicibacterium psychrotolerans TaxID=216929 RepID=UPI003D668233